MLFSFVRISYNRKSHSLLRLVPFNKATLRAVALITLAQLTQVICNMQYTHTHTHTYIYVGVTFKNLKNEL